MDENVKPVIEPRATKFGRRGAALAALGGAALFGAALVVGAAVATAATPSPSPGTTQSAATFDPTKGGHVGANGVVEKLLTGTTADKAKAAALAAVPGATVERVENDAEGAVYEAHMVKSDGTHVTVKMDANFKVTGIETGPNRPANG
jgi:peptidase YpeB-like protein